MKKKKVFGYVLRGGEVVAKRGGREAQDRHV